MKANFTPKIFGRAARTFTQQAIGLLISILVTTTVTRAAETNHAAVYQGIGNTYAEETSTILISSATLVAGSNFTFVSRNPADPVYSGNNVPGFIVYRDASNNLIRIYGVASRPEKSGSTFRGMYFYVADSTNGDAPTGIAYLIVFPGYAADFPGTGSIGTSSDPVDNVLNDQLAVITPGSVAASQTVCSGLAPAPFTSVAPATTTVGTITYQWQMSTDNISFTDITGANSDVYASGPVSTLTYFRRMATNTQGNAAPSNVLTISISAPPAAPSISPSGTVPFCTGLTVDLTASTTAPTYKWFLNGTLIPGANAQIYSASAAGSYRVLSINASGCESDTSTAVTVVANQAPVTTCPSNITVTNSPGTCGQTVTYSGTITGTPAPTITYTFSGATTGSGSGTGSGSVFGLGVTTVTITASNTCNTTSCSFTVTVTDSEAPTASNVTSSYSCLSAVPAADPAVITDEADNCGTPTVTFQSGLTTNNGGTGCAASPLIITRYYRVEDGSGNFILASHTITVVDNTAPTITSCPAPVTVSCAASVPAPNTALVTATENCGGTVTVTHVGDVISAQTCASRYTITRTYRATDACGNFTDCTQTITVNDQTAPTVTCPTAITVSCASAVPAPDINSVTSSDGCGGTVTVTHIGDVISAQTCASRYTITRTYRATDACGNFSDCTQTITVNDLTAPTVTCPAAITVSCASAVPAADIASVTASDNCGTPTVTHIGDVISAQTCANRYTITRTYRATDACGNFSDCTQTITVNDQTAPVIACPAPVTVSCASAVPAADIASVTASDNCGTVTVTHVGDVISAQTCANRYTITRTYRATDACGNFSDCTQTITVNDQTAPVLTCPAPVTVSCASAVPAPNIASVTGVSDNCGGTVTVTHVGDVISAQTCANRYTITRTYRATDACGNFTNCTQIITVNDQTAPLISCPAPVTVSCAGQVPAPNIASVTASDNCGTVTVTHIGDVISGQTCANRYTITRTYRATDACGNFSDCTQIITVNDITAPVITCPAPITVSCAAAVPAPNTALVNATDNCGGPVTIVFVSDVISGQTCANRYTISRTYRATDACGNSEVCTQVITVNDQTAPVLTCPANISVTTPIGSCTAVVNFTPTATDNCGGAVTIVSTPASGTAFPIGTTTVSVTATDACGNTSTCSFTVTVADGQLPVIGQQPQSRYFCEGTNASFSVTATNAVSYQWQQWTGSIWANISGATTATLTINTVSMNQNAATYRVLVIGLCTTVPSAAASYYVNPTPSVSISASQLNLIPGRTTNIISAVSLPGGSYRWFRNGGQLTSPLQQGPVLNGITIDGAGTYRLTYTDPNGCSNTSSDLVIKAEPSTKLWAYPNPTTGRITLRYYDVPDGKAFIVVYDEKGALLIQRPFVTSNPYGGMEIDLAPPGNAPARSFIIPNGNYVIVLYSQSGIRLGATKVMVHRQ